MNSHALLPWPRNAWFRFHVTMRSFVPTLPHRHPRRRSRPSIDLILPSGYDTAEGIAPMAIEPPGGCEASPVWGKGIPR